LKIRREHDVFVYGVFEEFEFENPDIYVYEKELKQEKILVLLNFTDGNTNFKSKENLEKKDIIINNYNDIEVVKDILYLKPYQGLIIQISKN